MKLVVVAVGHRLPGWAQTACDDYESRFPKDLRIAVKTVKAETRDGRPAAALMEAERGRIDAAIPAGARMVALDERGDALTTTALANTLQRWQADAIDVALLIGGPDGLAPALREKAYARIRLSDLTLPHALARVLLLEQLYRAWSINAGHPYHRE